MDTAFVRDFGAVLGSAFGRWRTQRSGGFVPKCWLHRSPPQPGHRLLLHLLRTEGDAFACQTLGNAVAGLVVAGETGTPHDPLAELASAAPGVVLLDLNLPGSDAFALLPALREQHPQLRLLAYGELTNEHYVARAFDLGAHGYIFKTSNFAELVHGLRTVAAGRPYLSSAIGMSLPGHLYASGPATAAAARAALGLSKRGLEVLGLVAEGLTNAEITEGLFTSKRTVETHRQNIMDKTQTRNTASLIKLAARQGLID